MQHLSQRPTLRCPPSITAAGTAFSPSALNCLPLAASAPAPIEAKRGAAVHAAAAAAPLLLQLPPLPPLRNNGRPAPRSHRCRARVAALPSYSHTPPAAEAIPHGPSEASCTWLAPALRGSAPPLCRMFFAHRRCVAARESERR